MIDTKKIFRIKTFYLILGLFFVLSIDPSYAQKSKRIGSWTILDVGFNCVIANGDGYRKGDKFSMMATRNDFAILMVVRKNWNNTVLEKKLVRIFFDGHEWDDVEFQGHKNPIILEGALRDKKTIDRFGYNLATRSKVAFQVGSERVEFRLKKTDEALGEYGKCFIKKLLKR
jgi:hypothetical protein